ncbi:MAG: Glutathione S-transferase, N-terminal [Proteobacteria bacterium]|nr:Glutathione S-transferase, N-terminal [Pseudomonadota bacterium]
MRTPLLYTYRRCPYAMRARMALLVAGIDFDAHEVSLRDKPAEMLVLSPKGSVPVMLLPDGTVLEQSWEIMCWALNREATKSWWDAGQAADNLDWLARNDGVFKQHLDRYKYPERYVDPDRIGHREIGLEEFLRPLATRLEQSTYLGGSTPCATDLAIFPFVRQFAAVDPDWFAQLQIPALQAWLSNWLSSPLFQHCMHKLPSQSTIRFPSFGRGLSSVGREAG